MSDANLEKWNHLYKEHLPQLAKARDEAQKKWPVHLDHCFARIILDNAIGQDRPWTAVLKSPAVNNMTSVQLTKAIGLAEDIANGRVDINQLNEQSLHFRGKKRKTESKTETSFKRIRRADDTISKYFITSTDQSSKPDKKQPTKPSNEESDQDSSYLTDVDMDVQLKKITASNLTSFRKEALSLLCQVPPGRYSTYQAMSDFISQSSHPTCARAVGSAMRNNPFAPEVPCHRILASDGSLGGFGGHWGEKGKFANQKHKLLHDEGVRFDSAGKVKGPVFREFTKSRVVE